MCLYTKYIINPKYKANKKNNGIIPDIIDTRLFYVPIACGKCIECRKKKAREWQIRLQEELRSDRYAHMVTLTFDDAQLDNLIKDAETEDANTIAALAVRRFTERWRKKHKKTIKHWLITELGHEGTERLHLHGILFTQEKDKIESIWKYGFIRIGTYVNNQTINYIIKYVTKIDNDHEDYEPKIFCSNGIGKGFFKRGDFKRAKFKGEHTQEEYILPNGQKTQLPMYYRNKLYNDEEKEQLWIQKLDQHTRYINGRPYSTETIKDIIHMGKVLEKAQEDNIKLGYGKPKAKFDKKSFMARNAVLNST